jgi:hypothetical protein
LDQFQVPPDLIEHANSLVPVLIWSLQQLVYAIIAVGGALIGVIWWIGKKFVAKVNSLGSDLKGMDRKIDVIHDAMLICDSCSAALQKVKGGRRDYDPPLPDKNDFL